ncbi:MAG: hypothetical protein WCR01_11555 [Bacteroidota bacterium]
MKRSTLIFTLLLQPLLFLDSCTNDHAQPPCGDPIPTSLQIYLVDKNDSLLIGRKYNQDSIKLTVNNKNIDIQISQGKIIFVYPDLVEYNNMNYLLSLSKNEIDTVNLVVYHNYVEDCGNYYGVGSMSYNSKRIEPVTGLVYKIIKN